MAMIVADCPRCNATDITFDVKAGRYASTEYGWRSIYGVYSECRRCFKGTILAIAAKDVDSAQSLDSMQKILSVQAALNVAFEVLGYVSLKDKASVAPPDYLPADVEQAFREGASCIAIGCYNAGGAMFRLAIDLGTKSLLPEGDGASGGPNRQQRKQLHERLGYLFDNQLIPSDLRELATCVKDDGNDGAHDGTLKQADAEDLCDFATELFKRMFTEPERLRLAKVRRDERLR